MDSAQEWQQRAAARFWQEEEQRAEIAIPSAMRRRLTKTELLRKKDDIDRIIKYRDKCSCLGMRLISLKNSLGYDRFIIIPAKHYGRAVDRNLLRRRAKEIFRNYHGRHPYQECTTETTKDYVLIVYPGKVSSFSLLESGFIDLLDRSNRK